MNNIWVSFTLIVLFHSFRFLRSVFKGIQSLRRFACSIFNAGEDKNAEHPRVSIQLLEVGSLSRLGAMIMTHNIIVTLKELIISSQIFMEIPVAVLVKVNSLR